MEIGGSLKHIFSVNNKNMKRIGLLLAVLSIFSFCSLDNSTATKLFSYFENGEVCFYCSSAETEIKNTIIQANGNGFIVATNIKNAIQVNKELTNCNGFSIKIDKNENIDLILKNIEIVKKETISNIKIVYGYTCGLTFCAFIDGKKVNIQIAENNEFITIGSPIILGSY